MLKKSQKMVVDKSERCKKVPRIGQIMVRNNFCLFYLLNQVELLESNNGQEQFPLLLSDVLGLCKSPER